MGVQASLCPDRVNLLFANTSGPKPLFQESTLIWIELKVVELPPSHTSLSLDEVTPIQIGKPILVWIMGVGVHPELLSSEVLGVLLDTGKWRYQV